MKTFDELGFEKHWENDGLYHYTIKDYKNRGKIRVYFYVHTGIWSISGWGDADAEIAMAIALECMKNKWLEV